MKRALWIVMVGALLFGATACGQAFVDFLDASAVPDLSPVDAGARD